MTVQNQNELVAKWAKVLDSEKMPAIAGSAQSVQHRRAVTAQLIENTVTASRQAREATLFEDTSSSAPTNTLGTSFEKYDPILISLVRRAMPNLMAYDVCGVQPMTGPTGLIFALRPKYIGNTAAGHGTDGTNDAFYYEADTDFSGTRNNPTPASAWTSPASYHDNGNSTPVVAGMSDAWSLKGDGTENTAYTTGRTMQTQDAEKLGSDPNNAFAEMGFTMDKVAVSVGSRALRADYSIELAQDMKNIHGLDVETELSNILVSEILSEINREVIRTVYTQAKIGNQQGDLTTAGVFDLSLDSNGRWAAERFKGMAYQVEREANVIAKETRRGKGNILICSSDVASALTMAGVLDYTKVTADLQVDDTGNTYAGVLNGKFKVFIDPYAPAGVDFVVVGYKGANQYDTGLFYCPYVPLQMFKTVGQDSFQPRIGFKTRYGMAVNPFAKGVYVPSATSDLSHTKNANVYYRKFRVKNLMDTAGMKTL